MHLADRQPSEITLNGQILISRQDITRESEDRQILYFVGAFTPQPRSSALVSSIRINPPQRFLPDVEQSLAFEARERSLSHSPLYSLRRVSHCDVILKSLGQKQHTFRAPRSTRTIVCILSLGFVEVRFGR